MDEGLNDVAPDTICMDEANTNVDDFPEEVEGVVTTEVNSLHDLHNVIEVQESGGCDEGGEIFEMLSSINGDDELLTSGTPPSNERISVQEEVHGESQLIDLAGEVFLFAWQRYN
ncbi:hypothetical protein AMTR_s00053p00184940 [Amborella trichopoda]|uniref:Uncharacterized protein n=1 Tax=Amborella trichopoda TaxID=13333 RepID=W1PBZ7_AMBTC|nr:hypothetical protein AMTR_s00053p00184940 [Amborella trichopoda]